MKDQPKATNPFKEVGFVLKGDDRRYLTDNDANTRIANGLVLYRDVPIWLSTYDGNHKCQATTWDGTQSASLDMNDADIDLISPNIGWVDCDDFAVHVTRSVERQQKQSLYPGYNCNASVLDIDSYTHTMEAMGGGVPPYHVSPWHTTDFTPTPGITPGRFGVYYFGRAIVGEYPTIRDILKRQGKGGAFSVDWALVRSERGTLVLHGAHCIGYFDEKSNGFFILADRFTKTRELSLTQLIGKAGINYGITRIYGDASTEIFDVLPTR